MKTILFLLSCAVVFAPLGCELSEPNGTPGALHEGGFGYCELPTKPCDVVVAIPDRIATGSTFWLSYETVDDPSVDVGSEDIVLTSSDSAQLAIDETSPGGAHFHALHAGAATVEVRNPTNDSLLDYVSLTLSDPSRLSVQPCARAYNAIPKTGDGFDPASCDATDAGRSGLEISRGTSLASTVCVSAYDGSGVGLGGSLPLSWTASGGDASTVELFIGDDPRCATLGGVRIGDSTVSIVDAALTTSLTVTVDP